MLVIQAQRRTRSFENNEHFICQGGNEPPQQLEQDIGINFLIEPFMNNYAIEVIGGMVR
jgi:hypothetical protein